MAKVPVFQLPELLQWQLEVLTDTSQYKVVCVGRQAGKSFLASVMAFMTASNGGYVWWLGPTYSLANKGWKNLKELAQSINKNFSKPPITIKEYDRIIEFPTGGWVQVKTADNPDTLVGETLDLVIFDEAARTKAEAWDNIRPSLQIKNGSALFISTPLGKNWFFDLFMMGNSNEFPNYKSWQLPSTVNPLMTKEKLEEERTSMKCEWKFRREYLAEFQAGGESVFSNIYESLTSVIQLEAIEGHRYLFGIDWGRMNDFTVITVIDVTELSLVFIDRFTNLSFPHQRERVKTLYSKFKPYKIISENNNFGVAANDDLLKEGLPIIRFDTTQVSKGRIIESLSVALANNHLSLLNNQELIEELEVYEVKSSGIRDKYSAPTGFHDDIVMSLAIAYSGIKRQLPNPITFSRNTIGV